MSISKTPCADDSGRQVEMAADNGEDEAVLDVKVPSRRRRASDDEADEAEFHDAAEYAASVADSQALDRGEDAIQEVHSGSSNEDDGASGSDAEGRLFEPALCVADGHFLLTVASKIQQKA